MFSRAVAVCSRFSVYSYTAIPRIIPRAVAPPSQNSLRHFGWTRPCRSPAVLAHAPTQADIEADEEFSDSELLPAEEAKLNITDAAQQLRNISVREQDEDVSLRVLVESGGCHGYQYKLELTSKRHHFVRPPTTPGRVGVVVDPISLSLCDQGSTIDFATELIGSSFRVQNNPQATGKGCGCGVSWDLKARTITSAELITPHDRTTLARGAIRSLTTTMPTVPRTSPATLNPVPEHYIHTTAGQFVDAAGRVILLRGVNLAGSTKAPVDRPTQYQDVWDVAEAGGESFVGRPLNLDDGSADIHLARLRAWGFNCLRFIFTWEALEHEGPYVGKYDYEYIQYTIRVLRRCKDFGFRVFMDPHQDVWSRFTGGSGAPFWTLPACGLNPRHITATHAALLHFEQPDPSAFPAMVWSTNYARFASQTIWTLFFAGRDYAPRCVIDGVNIQDWLQRHYINACGVLADAIRDAGDLYDSCIIGWDSINEPGEGYLGLHDLNVIPPHQSLKKTTCPTPAQGIRLASGIAQTVENWAFGALGPKRDGYVTIDPAGRTIWANPDTEEDVGDGTGDRIHKRWGWRRAASWPLGKCIWALHGVWAGPDVTDTKSGDIPILKPDYFERPPFDPSRHVVFVADYWRPHFRDYIARIRPSHPESIFFVQPPVFVQPPPLEDEDLCGRGAYSSHYYDGLTLMTRHWNWFNADALGLLRGKYSSVLGALRIGERAIRNSLRDQLGMLKSDALEILGQYPTLIGEIGVPFDMDAKRSYGLDGNSKYVGDYTDQTRALDCSLNGADGNNVINWTLWTYAPDNTHTWGDGWNLEDLALWSMDDANRDRGTQEFQIESSSANLLNGENQDSRNRSESTLGTLRGPAGPADAQQPRPQMDMSLKPTCASPDPASPVGISADKLYDFVVVGARGIGALARPWPVATVGTPTYIDFNIAKATFELKIKVTGSDRAWGGKAPIRSSLSDLGEDDEELSTEIYIPLVHYAADSAFDGESLPNCEDAPGLPKVTEEPPRYRDDDDSTVVGHLRQDSKSSADSAPAVKRRRATTTTLRRQRADTTNTLIPILPIPSSEPTATSASAAASPTTLPIPLSAQSIMGTLVESDMLALDVQVSEGKWELDGQVLRWWYDVPGEGEPEKELTIKVQRRGGPIKGVLRGFGAISPASAAREGGRRFWDVLCPNGGCVVA
ncbi:cytoplasmic protein [Rhizoctonia solani AG-1 IA]|uniref:Cytoplasmic protein n=1 Tax=Thanatephorus cucumeris (strain AG1-IA) TaxID=983506 RepID=L8X324_THACA|nr:cytoplasmic protein [Rhizoctonia solani AG-1 IA]